MASRRMFSIDVINTDKFMEMPITAQCLYFHLGMRADDDGFISSPRQILKMTTCTQGDMKTLLENGYIIPFESGIVVIRHWKQHNYIKPDRYHPTKYQHEFALLSINENEYDLDTSCIQIGTNKDPQVRDRLELGKDRVRIDYQQIADMYNDICISFPRLTKMSEQRKKAIKARLNTYNVDDFKKLFEMAEGSSFLKGQNGRDWSATFDWLIKDANMAKVLDGNYTDAKGVETIGNKENEDRGQASDYYEELMQRS